MPLTWKQCVLELWLLLNADRKLRVWSQSHQSAWLCWKWPKCPKCCKLTSSPPPPQPFYGPFSGTTQVSRCQKRTSGFYGARED